VQNLLSVPALCETEASDAFIYEVSGALEFEGVVNWRIEFIVDAEKIGFSLKSLSVP